MAVEKPSEERVSAKRRSKGKIPANENIMEITHSTQLISMILTIDIYQVDFTFK